MWAKIKAFFADKEGLKTRFLNFITVRSSYKIPGGLALVFLSLTVRWEFLLPAFGFFWGLKYLIEGGYDLWVDPVEREAKFWDFVERRKKAKELSSKILEPAKLAQLLIFLEEQTRAWGESGDPDKMTFRKSLEKYVAGIPIK